MLKKDIEEIKKYRKLFPESIKVLVIPLKEGYGARIIDFEGSITEASSFSELIAMVNDLVRSILKIPEKYADDMLEYLPPLELAQKFYVFPKVKKESTIKFFSKMEGTVV